MTDSVPRNSDRVPSRRPWHCELAAGRWREFPLVVQLAHVGSDVLRAINWQNKGNDEYSAQAIERALELLDLALEDPKNANRRREPALIRMLLVDYFQGENRYCSTPRFWRGYYRPFAYAARAAKRPPV